MCIAKPTSTCIIKHFHTHKSLHKWHLYSSACTDGYGLQLLRVFASYPTHAQLSEECKP